MTRWRRALLATALLPALAVLVAGCELGQDDEMARPTRTVTATPTPEAAPVPEKIPVGSSSISPRDVVWGDGARLHVGRRSVDLAPAEVAQLVVVDGGVYVLSGDELWFTDLQRLRGTGLTGVTDIAPSDDGRQLLVTEGRSGRDVVHAYDVSTGDRLDTTTTPSASPEPSPRAPGASTTEFTGYPEEFSLAGWAGPSTFYGVARKDGRPASVVSCRVSAKSCTVLGPIRGADPVVFPRRG